MNNHVKGLLLFFFGCVSLFSSAQHFLKTAGPQIVKPDGEKINLRGMGLGGWMLQEGYMLRVRGIGQQQHVIRKNLEALMGKEKTDEFYSAWLANHTRRIDIDSMASWGFNSVRLAMHYNLYTLPVEEEPVAGQHTWLEQGFAMTDSLLKWCAANQLYLILDLHAAPGGQGNDLNISDRDPAKPSLWESEANQRKTVALWRKLAERYANEPWIGAYDIINEPNWGFESKDDKNGCNETTNAPLKKLMVEITNAIREVDRNHIIIIEGNCWGNNYNGILPPWDDNTVISFHKYWNFNDQASVQKFVDIRQQYNTPVWMGESGENSNLWFRDAIYRLEQNEIGWAWWPLKKLGFNNPLEVVVPEGYHKILNYWRGEGPKPSAEEAYRAVIQLAENLKLENCIYHKDVTDAMFRQVSTEETRPFKKHVVKKGLAIASVDYDLGRNGFAYFDNDTANYWVSGMASVGNRGHTYRNDGVDIARQGNTFYVDSLESGEWLQYSVISRAQKFYRISLQVSSPAAGRVQVMMNNRPYEIPVPVTHGSWEWVLAGKVQLRKGVNVIRVKAIDGGFDFQALKFE
jgi:endoglucanase